jgi:hypothetical protein
MDRAPQGPTAIDTRVTLLSNGFQMRGMLKVMGNLQTFMNNDLNPAFTLSNIEVTGISPTNPVHMTQPEIIIGKQNVQAVFFDERPAQGEIVFLPRTEDIVVYMDNFALAGKMYLGQDARVNDFIDASLQQFLVMTDLTVYPVVPVRTELVMTASVAMLQKNAIRFYHRG